MHYHIDKTAAQSAYLQLYHQLRRDIVSGVYLLGTKMPSKRLIATETGVSVITVEHALAILCDEGYLESRERSGFFVSFAAADCFPVSETETERRTTVSHGTEDEFPFPSLAIQEKVLTKYYKSHMEDELSEKEKQKRDDRLRRMEAAREQQRKYAAEEAEKKSLKEKRAEKQAAKSMKKKNSTNESGRVGDRPYARGRSYDPEHYGE